MPRIAIVAGELSGDRLGAGLIRALQARIPGVEIAGVAGPGMAAAGAVSWYPASELSVMGLAEVVRHLPRLRRIMTDLRQRLLADPPDIFIGIDAPDFNLRLEPALKAAGIPVIHYVSPSVWAWRPGRVRVLQRACDLVLCLLPFEADFLAAHGVPGEFVGHPLAEDLASVPDQAAARRSLGLPEAGPVVAILPGSRAGEVSRLGPVFAGAAGWLASRLPEVHCVAPMATAHLGALFAGHLQAAGSSAGVTLLEGRSHQAMAAADVVLLASGTATLEAMLLGRPMVVAYRMSPLTYGLLRGLRLVKVAHIALPNLLAGQRLVPELLQEQASPEALGAAVLALLADAGQRQRIQARFATLAGELRRGASERAADAVVRLLAARGRRRAPGDFL